MEGLSCQAAENKGVGFPVTSRDFFFTQYWSAVRNEVCLLADMRHTSYATHGTPAEIWEVDQVEECVCVFCLSVHDCVIF